MDQTKFPFLAPYNLKALKLLLVLLYNIIHIINIIIISKY